LQLEESTVDLVNDHDWFDTLSKGLAEHGFGLYADAFDTVYYD
jgi:hypothetical protein